MKQSLEEIKILQEGVLIEEEITKQIRNLNRKMEKGILRVFSEILFQWRNLPTNNM